MNLIFSCLCVCFVVAPPASLTERDYCEQLAEKYDCDGSVWVGDVLHDDGIEVPLPDRTRCDLLNDRFAYEVEHAKNHYQAPGQATHYSIQTGRRAAVILITRDPKADARHIQRSRAICKRLLIPISVEVVGDDLDIPLTLAP